MAIRRVNLVFIGTRSPDWAEWPVTWIDEVGEKEHLCKSYWEQIHH